jgi:hypothetical protein
MHTKAFGAGPRSLTSSVHSGPSAEKVRSALTEWAAALMEANDRVQRVGLFGSYARGDWATGGWEVIST